jgi:hypothetical protein
MFDMNINYGQIYLNIASRAMLKISAALKFPSGVDSLVGGSQIIAV